ncbi:MAG: hypothetical protein GYA02_16740 [Clostridiaceae bacterium]|nr:hypothetical protein [Clostridiaceae bacterium]
MFDFEEQFAKFVNNGQGSAIKDIYEIIPSLNNEQIRIINALNYYVKKYDLVEVREMIGEYKKAIIKNKNLGFLSSMNMKNLLKAYTQEELVKGIKINAQQRNDEL